MVGEDTMTMSAKELRRGHVIRQVRDKRITQGAAGTLLGLTDRQIRRHLRRVKQEGDQGLVHRGRGKPSNRRIAEPIKTKAFGCTTRAMGLWADVGGGEAGGAGRDHAECRDAAGWLMAKGMTHFRRRKRPHRAWRARKAHVGELVQLDGSHHDWLEGLGPRCVLMAYIDDASSRVFARF